MRSISQVGAWSKDRRTPAHFPTWPPYLRAVALQFEKWEGTGNDFVLVDGRLEGQLPSLWADEDVQALCHRDTGVGSDGVVVVTPTSSGELRVDFRNPDGSRSFCGNGTRSALAWAHRAGLVGSEAVIHAVDGLHHGRIRADGTPGISLNVIECPKRRKPAVRGSVHAAFVNTGSPHHVEFLTSREELDQLDLVTAALPIRHREDYAPGGCNVNIVAPTETGLAIRTFERGVEAETLSCGTGVVASALADIARSDHPQGNHSRKVHARGGTLTVLASRQASGKVEDVWLFGAARKVFQGTWAWALVFFALWSDSALASQLSDQLSDVAQVSVLTASPGQDLYSAFGHTAIRVFDPATQADWVFNYGTFLVNDGFYLRFVRGRMDYRLGVERYSRFQNLYLRQGRALHEHVLNLSPEDARALTAYLEHNAEPENATYAYDFFRDNCATKVIAVLTEVFGDRFDAHCYETDSTYLEALRPFTAGNPWSAWGMELILGAEAASPMPACGHAFLPDVLAHQLDAMTLDGQPLAFPREVVFPNEGQWHAGLEQGDVGRNAPAALMWGWALWMALVWRLAGRGSTWRRWARRASVAVTATASSLMTLLFVLMALLTDHNDTWWNADVVWTLGGWGLLWIGFQSWKGRRREDLRWEHWVARIWTVGALSSVLVVPAFRSGLGWVESMVWASVGACLSVVLAVWMVLDGKA